MMDSSVILNKTSVILKYVHITYLFIYMTNVLFLEEKKEDKKFQLTQLKFQQLLCTWVALGTTYMGTGPNGLNKVSL